MLSVRTAAVSGDVCYLRPAEPAPVQLLVDEQFGMRRLGQFLRGAALSRDACHAVAEAVRRHCYTSQRSLDIAGLRDELCLRWQRATPHSFMSIFKAPGVWAAIAADLLPDGSTLRHVVLPFISSPRELTEIMLAAFAAGITSVEVSFPPPGHAASPYTLDLREWVPPKNTRPGERLVLWIKCGPDAEGLVLAPPGLDLGVHPLTGVHVPGVQICEPASSASTSQAGDARGSMSCRAPLTRRWPGSSENRLVAALQ